MDYLYTNSKSWGQQGCKVEELGVCTKIVSMRSEGNNHNETVTIMRKRVRVLMGTNGGFCLHHRWGGYLDAHQVLVLAQNTGNGDGCPSTLFSD